MPRWHGWSHSSLHLWFDTIFSIKVAVLSMVFNGRREESSTCSSVYMVTGCLSQPVVEVLENEPFVHPMVRIHKDVLLKPIPSFWNGLIGRLLEAQNPSAKSITIAHREELH